MLLVSTLMLLGTACGAELDIVHGLNEFEANEILVVLASQGIQAKKLKEEGRQITYAVIVPESDSQTALALLVNNKLPKERSAGLADVYPAGGGGLIPTKSEEKAKFLMAMQGELEQKLKSMPGIQAAHVSVVVPEKDVIRDLDTAPPQPSASVILVFNPSREGEPPVHVDRVKAIVAAAIEDLKPERVEVLLKANEPMQLVGVNGQMAGPAAAAGEPVLGIRVADEDSGKKAMILLIVFASAGVLGLILGVVGIVRSVMLKSKLSRAEAELASLKKARAV